MRLRRIVAKDGCPPFNRLSRLRLATVYAATYNPPIRPPHGYAATQVVARYGHVLQHRQFAERQRNRTSQVVVAELQRLERDQLAQLRRGSDRQGSSRKGRVSAASPVCRTISEWDRSGCCGRGTASPTSSARPAQVESGRSTGCRRGPGPPAWSASLCLVELDLPGSFPQAPASERGAYPRRLQRRATPLWTYPGPSPITRTGRTHFRTLASASQSSTKPEFVSGSGTTMPAKHATEDA